MTTPSTEEIAQQLQEYIRTSIVDEQITIETDTPFSKLGIDSMGIIELVLFIERKFRITLPESELVPSNFRSVASLAECAFRNLKK